MIGRDEAACLHLPLGVTVWQGRENWKVDPLGVWKTSWCKRQCCSPVLRLVYPGVVPCWRGCLLEHGSALYPGVPNQGVPQGHWHLLEPPVIWGCAGNPQLCVRPVPRHKSSPPHGQGSCGNGHTGPHSSCTGGGPCNMGHSWGSGTPSGWASPACLWCCPLVLSLSGRNFPCLSLGGLCHLCGV